MGCMAGSGSMAAPSARSPPGRRPRRVRITMIRAAPARRGGAVYCPVAASTGRSTQAGARSGRCRLAISWAPAERGRGTLTWRSPPGRRRSGPALDSARIERRTFRFRLRQTGRPLRERLGHRESTRETRSSRGPTSSCGVVSHVLARIASSIHSPINISLASLAIGCADSPQSGPRWAIIEPMRIGHVQLIRARKEERGRSRSKLSETSRARAATRGMARSPELLSPGSMRAAPDISRRAGGMALEQLLAVRLERRVWQGNPDFVPIFLAIAAQQSGWPLRSWVRAPLGLRRAARGQPLRLPRD
jgi:hypothetical protein